MALERATDGIRIARLDRWDSDPGLEEAWTALLERCASPSVFQTFAWHTCWWKAFRESNELFLLVARRGSELVGIAPLMISRGNGALGRMRKEVCFIGSANGASDYCDFIIDPSAAGVLHALLKAVEAGARGFNRIDLSHVPAHSPTRAGIQAYFAGRDAKVAVEFQADAPVRVLGDGPADRKAANKSSLKRHTRYFERSGTLRYRECPGEEEILAYLDAFFEQHRARRGQTAHPSQFLDPAQRQFYRDLVREAFRHGWIRFAVVLFDGAPLAFHFGFEYRNSFLWYKPTFDVRHASRSPGEVLIKYLLEAAIARGIGEFDFGVGAEAFKFRFANRIRSNERIVVFSSAADYWVHRAAGRGKSVLKKWLGRPGGSRASERFPSWSPEALPGRIE